MDISGLETRNQFVASACLSALNLLVHEVCYTGERRHCPKVLLFIYLFRRENTYNNEIYVILQAGQASSPGTEGILQTWIGFTDMCLAFV